MLVIPIAALVIVAFATAYQTMRVIKHFRTGSAGGAFTRGEIVASFAIAVGVFVGVAAWVHSGLSSSWVAAIGLSTYMQLGVVLSVALVLLVGVGAFVEWCASRSVGSVVE